MTAGLRSPNASVIRLREKQLTSKQRIVLRRNARLSNRTRQLLFSSSSVTAGRGPVAGVRMKTAPKPQRKAIVAQQPSLSGERALPVVNLRPAAPAATALPDFPLLGQTVHPFARVPNWGTMHSAAEWDRRYEDMTESDFVPTPAYDLSILTRPMADFTKPITDATIPAITMKLYYSTIYCSPYTINQAAEYTGTHCGIDFKVADGTPVRSIGGGRIAAVRNTADLGRHVLVEYRLPEGGRVVAIYAHLGGVSVQAGQDVAPGTIVGTVGMTGNTSGPHLHLQIDRLADGEDAATHAPYVFGSVPSPADADRHMVHPIRFIERYGR